MICGMSIKGCGLVGDYRFYDESLEEWGIPRITLAQDGRGAVFYPFRVVCDALALDRGTYAAFVREDSRTARGVREIRAPTAGGPQPTLYLRRRELAIWLALIDPSRVGKRAKAAGRLHEFQAALWHLAERVAFKSKASADASATPAPVLAALEGSQRTMTHCPDCGSPLRAEVRDGKLYLWHAGADTGAELGE